MIVLDTNIISELMRSEPAARVSQWVDRQPAPLLYVTAITEAEVLHGIELMAKGKKRDALAQRARFMIDRAFAGRVLPFASAAAAHYADIAAARRRAGRPISQLDAQIAAITRSQRATLATRDTDDFADCGIDVIDPWTVRG